MPVDICETTVPSNWNAGKGKLQLSSRHFKSGNESIAWNWDESAQADLEIRDTALLQVADQARSTFVVWIYNEIPVDDHLVFRFGDGKNTSSSFQFGLNFKGWRTAWVMYHRDMQGKPVKNMNTLRIEAPRSVKKGTIYLDQMLMNVTINPRSPMRDEQLPFVNREADRAANAHWTALYSFSRNPQRLALPAAVSEVEKQEIEKITSRYRAVIFPAEEQKAKISMSAIEKSFFFWKIQRKSGVITGRPVHATNDVELVSLSSSNAVKALNQETDVKKYTQFMLQVAQAYHSEVSTDDKGRLEGYFMDLLDHMDDQGWAFGSGMGALHHHGYNLSGYYSACLLMKDVIKRHGALERTFKSMAWFSGLGRCLQALDQLPSSNIDVFNTLLGSMLSAILIRDDSPEKLRYLQSYAQWLSKNIEPDHTIEGAFKPDGAVFHHGNLYPAYGIGGYTGITPIVYVLSRTRFSLDQDARESLKKSLMLMHYYTNPYKWPISVSGRHPTGGWKIADLPYAYMALSGSPDGTQELDQDMASIYLRLNPNKPGKWGLMFKKAGIKPAAYPSGHWNMNFGLFDIHRRQDWLLTVRGHNRYFVSHESYPGANMYGRYLAYGHLEVSFPASHTDSGSHFKDEGWDWNNIPGTTTLHLPLNKLRANVINPDDYSGIEEMLITDEIFAGGTHLDQQGLFAMKLHGHDKYDMGTFRATKSWFMFDSLVVCLGSGISNQIAEYPTETTIFQNYLKNSSDSILVNGKDFQGFPRAQEWKNDRELAILDNRGIGYYIPEASGVLLTKSRQTSRDQKDSGQTSGDFAKLIFQHGKAPVNQGYAYAMLIKTNRTKLNQLVAAQKKGPGLYQVLRQDGVAHSVWYAPARMTGLAIFGAKQKLADPLILENNRPCLIMYQTQKEKLKLAVTDPDLAFYTGPDDSPLTASGKRKEVSIYSRNWYRTPSNPGVVQLLIKGRWNLASGDKDVELVLQPDGNTLLKVTCSYGAASTIELKK
ncbi:chondroitinase family polysaccharide lyase [Pedobacter sp. MC2016-24]|uniref:chondroitinase family polysaccharide lyase n=1 Tax=Pedobacter sp. MC2016-24 TaxID=2780090 RepID=UPI001D167117|nr:chondroitinase family polysaccharide lyase [Pedobacter sp. MC2016-24]